MGIDTWLHISVENGFLKFNGDKNGVSSHSDLKRWQGFFYTKPTAKISYAGKTPQRWNMRKKFPLNKFFSNSSQLSIQSVTLMASGRADCSIHTDPANVNQIPQSDIKKNNFIVWNKDNIKIYDNDHGSSPYIIKIIFSSEQNGKRLPPFVSQNHNLLSPQPRKDSISLDQFVFNKRINMDMLSLKKIHKIPIKKCNLLFDFQDEEKLYAQYWGVSKNRLIANEFSFLQKTLAEVATNYTTDGKLRSMDFIIYSVDESNRLSNTQFKKLSDELLQKICSRLGHCTQNNNFSVGKSNNPDLWRIWQWNHGDKSVELNIRFDRHIYIRISPIKKIKRPPKDIASDSIKKINGTFFINHIPMVNQGGKGYCVPATFSAVLLYWGFEINQYALSATDIKDFILAAKLPLTFYRVDMQVPPREYIVKKYNSKKATRYEQLTAKELYEKFDDVRKKADISLLHKICSNDKVFYDFKNNLITHINNGIPICWGVFGHVRMIIGYDLSKNEIIYRDSWGKNHLKKRMNMYDAFLISNEFLIIKPK